MSTPRLLVVADLEYAGSEARLIEVIDALAPVATGTGVAVQLRAKALEHAAVAGLARAVREHLPGAFLVLNGNAEVARDLGYQGVHWPESALPGRVPAAPGWHSAAVHSIEALRRAEEAGVDAVIFGSVFAPGSKPGDAAGLDALRTICTRARVPVIAIGGVTPARAAACIEAGASGVAAVSGVLDDTDPASAVSEYLDAVQRAARTEVRR